MTGHCCASGRHRGLDFSAEIRVLVDGVTAGDSPPAQWAALADEKLAEVDALIARAQATRRLLEALRACDCRTLEDCAGRASNGR